MATPEQMKAIIDKAATDTGVDPVLLKAIAQIESNFNPTAISPTGATGLFQFTKGTARDYGLVDRKDPVANAYAAARLLKDNAKSLGLTPTVDNAAQLYMAHQQGVGGVRAMLANPNSSAEKSLGRNATVNAMGGLSNKQGFDLFAKKIATAVAQNGGGKISMSDTAFGSGSNIAEPQSQLAAVTGYNSQMVEAAQKIADNNLAAVNNFNWNPNTKDSSAQRFGKTVSANTDALSQLYDTNMREMQAFTNPTADTYLGRVGDKLGAMWNVSGNTLTERYLKRAEANQSSTGKAMAEQVANMKSVLDGTVINPAILDKAAGNLTQQQQVENQTYNVVTDNANTQQQLKQQMDIANMQNETEKAKIAIAQQKANGVVDNPDDSSLVNAARSLGIQLPEGMKTSDIKATLGDKLATVQQVAANNGKLGSDPYTAVKVAQMPGVSPEVLMAAQPHIAFQQQVLANAGLTPPGMIVDKEGKLVANPMATKETIAAEQAAYDAKARAIVIKAYEDAANGVNTPNLKGVAANMYSAMRKGEEIKTLANGLPLPKGIEPSEVGTLGAEGFINKATAAGATSLEIANFYKGLANNVNKDIKFDIFAAPKPTGKFVVKLKGVDNSIDLASPAGVEQFKAVIKAGGVQRDQKGGFLGMLRSAYNNDAATFARVAAGGNLIYE